MHANLMQSTCILLVNQFSTSAFSCFHQPVQGPLSTKKLRGACPPVSSHKTLTVVWDANRRPAWLWPGSLSEPHMFQGQSPCLWPPCPHLAPTAPYTQAAILKCSFALASALDSKKSCQGQQVVSRFMSPPFFSPHHFWASNYRKEHWQAGSIFMPQGPARWSGWPLSGFREVDLRKRPLLICWLRVLALFSTVECLSVSILRCAFHS